MEYNKMRYVATSATDSLTINEARLLMDTPCTGQLQGDHVLVHATCLLHDTFPRYDREMMVDDMREDVISFDRVYDLEATSYDVSPSRLYLADRDRDPSSLRIKRNSDISVIMYLMQHDIKVAIPKQYIARYHANNHGLYAVHKNDLEQQSSCARTNYLLAVRSLDGLRLEPGESFEINQHITDLPGYCRGSKRFMFYGGVCGASTQLYRLGLMHPEIYVVERTNHNTRYTRYYAEYLYSDDAAIYENFKKMIIRNDSDDTMIFKLLEKERETTLAVFSLPTSKKSSVTKKQTWPLSWIVRKVVTDQWWQLLHEQEWHSRYLKIDHGSN